MGLLNIFKNAINRRAVSAAFLGVVSASSAAAQTIPFQGHNLNCATLQGAQDPMPGGITCGFVEEVEQYFNGPMLNCDPNEVGYSPVALQAAARHLDVSHDQPALYGHVQTTIARINARGNGTQPMAELQATNPGEASGLYATWLAIEGTRDRMERGDPFNTAVTTVAGAMDENGYRLPSSSGSTAQDRQDLIRENPVTSAYLQCSARYPQPTWDHFEQ